MVKDIITVAFNSLEVEKTKDNNNNITVFTINTPPIIIRNKAILKVSNFCHIGNATGHTDNMYLFRIRGIIADTSRFFTGSGGGNPLILTTTFNNNRSLYDENVITLVKQTINTIDILVDTYIPIGIYNTVDIVNGGSGYLANQILRFTGGGTTEIISLKIDTVSNGAITKVTLLDTPTSVYSTPPTLSTFINGTGANINLTWNANMISGAIIINGGSGYKVGQTLQLATNVGSGGIVRINNVDANGTISNPNGLVVDNGGNYTTAPAVLGVNSTTQTQTASLIPVMIFGQLLKESIPNSLNFSITFIIEQDINE